MPSPANKLTTHIIRFIYEQGGFAFRVNTQGTYDAKRVAYRSSPKKGISDILAVFPPAGRFIAIEVKIGKDKLSPEQEGFGRNIIYYGGVFIIAKTFEDFKEQWQKKIIHLPTP